METRVGYHLLRSLIVFKSIRIIFVPSEDGHWVLETTSEVQTHWFCFVGINIGAFVELKVPNTVKYLICSIENEDRRDFLFLSLSYITWIIASYYI